MTTTTGSGAGREPALAEAIAKLVAESRRRRVQLADLMEAAASVDRTAASAVGWRGRVRAALEDLRDGGQVKWPKASFDQGGVPPLPTWVARPAPTRPDRPARRAPVWRAELAWAAEPDAALSPEEVNLLAR